MQAAQALLRPIYEGGPSEWVSRINERETHDFRGAFPPLPLGAPPFTLGRGTLKSSRTSDGASVQPSIVSGKHLLFEAEPGGWSVTLLGKHGGAVTTPGQPPQQLLTGTAVPLRSGDRITLVNNLFPFIFEVVAPPPAAAAAASFTSPLREAPAAAAPAASSVPVSSIFAGFAGPLGPTQASTTAAPAATASETPSKAQVATLTQSQTTTPARAAAAARGRTAPLPPPLALSYTLLLPILSMGNDYGVTLDVTVPACVSALISLVMQPGLGGAAKLLAEDMCLPRPRLKALDMRVLITPPPPESGGLSVRDCASRLRAAFTTEAHRMTPGLTVTLPGDEPALQPPVVVPSVTLQPVACVTYCADTPVGPLKHRLQVVVVDPRESAELAQQLAVPAANVGTEEAASSSSSSTSAAGPLAASVAPLEPVVVEAGGRLQDGLVAAVTAFAGAAARAPPGASRGLVLVCPSTFRLRPLPQDSVPAAIIPALARLTSAASSGALPGVPFSAYPSHFKALSPDELLAAANAQPRWKSFPQGCVLVQPGPGSTMTVGAALALPLGLTGTARTLAAPPVGQLVPAAFPVRAVIFTCAPSRLPLSPNKCPAPGSSPAVDDFIAIQRALSCAYTSVWGALGGLIDADMTGSLFSSPQRPQAAPLPSPPCSAGRGGGGGDGDDSVVELLSQASRGGGIGGAAAATGGGAGGPPPPPPPSVPPALLAGLVSTAPTRQLRLLAGLTPSTSRHGLPTAGKGKKGSSSREEVVLVEEEDDAGAAAAAVEAPPAKKRRMTSPDASSSKAASSSSSSSVKELKATYTGLDRTVLHEYSKRPEDYIPSVVHIASSDQSFVVVKDKYPKARLHLLVLARSNGPAPLLAGVNGVRELKPAHVPALKRMAAVAKAEGEAAWSAAYPRAPPPRLLYGFHANPSLQPLHLHIISDDLDSPHLKTPAHFLSFATSFFVPIAGVINSLSSTGHLPSELGTHDEMHALVLVKTYAKVGYTCPRCSMVIPTDKRIEGIKAHLNVCSGAMR